MLPTAAWHVVATTAEGQPAPPIVAQQDSACGTLTIEAGLPEAEPLTSAPLSTARWAFYAVATQEITNAQTITAKAFAAQAIPAQAITVEAFTSPAIFSSSTVTVQRRRGSTATTFGSARGTVR